MAGNNSETMKAPDFTKREMKPGTWVIEGVGCMSYLLLGTEKAVLIDSGMSPRDLHAYCREITALPIFGVINTHGHFDHTGGNGWFGKAYMHPMAAGAAKKPFGQADPKLLEYEIEILKDGQIIDIGGRPLEIIYIGAHSPGSIAILDKAERLLFTGDELEAGQVLLMFDEPGLPVTQTVENHQKQTQKLKSREHEFDLLCPSHNGTPIAKYYLNLFIEADQMILDGVEGKNDISSPTMPFPNNGFTKRLEHNGANICYDVRKIRGK